MDDLTTTTTVDFDLCIDDLTPHTPLASVMTRGEWTSADLTGRFPLKSLAGNECILVFRFHGHIHVEPVKSKSAKAYIEAYKLAFNLFEGLGHTATAPITDNETSGSETLFSLPPPPS